jgi:hypothetical protein
MTQRNRECKVQVQASRVSARMAGLAVITLALALTRYPATLGDDEARSARGMRANQSRSGRHTELQKGTLGGSNRLLSSRDVAAILAIPSEPFAISGRIGDYRPTKSESTCDGKNATYTRGSNASPYNPQVSPLLSRHARANRRV